MHIDVNIKSLKEEKGMKSYLVYYSDVVNAFLGGENFEVFASITIYCTNQTRGGMSQHPDYIYLESIKKGTNISNANIIRVDVLGYYNILEHLKQNFSFYEYVKDYKYMEEGKGYRRIRDNYPPPIVIARAEIKDPDSPCYEDYQIPITNKTFRKMLDTDAYAFNITVVLIDGRIFNHTTVRTSILNAGVGCRIPKAFRIGGEWIRAEEMILNLTESDVKETYPSCLQWYKWLKIDKYWKAEYKRAEEALEKEKGIEKPTL
ncbi:MAG: hypothetical protein ABH874_05715 [Methanobacteriota archaeon]